MALEALKRLFSGSLRRSPLRSRSLGSIDNSLRLIAAALRIIVLKEYKLDIAEQQPSKADERREIWEPMYVNAEREAIREEVERIRGVERELVAASGVRVAANGPKREPKELKLNFGRVPRSSEAENYDFEAAGGADSAFGGDLEALQDDARLTADEKRWLAELESEKMQADEPAAPSNEPEEPK